VIPVVLGSERPRVLGHSINGDAYKLPQIFPYELQLFGRSGDDFGEVFLRVRVFLRSSFTDRPRVSARGRIPFRQKQCFSDGSAFSYGRPSALVFRTVPPSLADSPRQLGGQSDLYAESCQV
jgi:hypothetical protein